MLIQATGHAVGQQHSLIEQGKCPPDTEKLLATRCPLAREVCTSRMADLCVLFSQPRLTKPGGVSFVQPMQLERACLFLEQYSVSEKYALASCVEDHVIYGLLPVVYVI